MPLRRACRAAAAAVMLLAACAAPPAPGPAAEPAGGTFRGPAAAEVATWLPRALPDARLRYGGESPAQFGDLRLPPGRAPARGHPVAVLLHGGAWHADWTLDQTAPLAEALAARGIATWNVEYRRLGNRGGGFPGTFADAGRATDHLRALAARHPLDLDRVVLVGHSAGGHLALWTAGRARLPAGHPLRGADPLPVAGAIALAGIPDLEWALARGGREDVRDLIGAPVPARLAETSPRRLLPLGAPQVLVIGSRDEPWRRAMTEAYAAAARASGDTARLDILQGADHADVIDPHGPIVPLLAGAIRALAPPAPR